MKKLVYIFFIIAAGMALVASCVREEWDVEKRKSEEVVIEEGTPITIEGSLLIPKESDDTWATRAFTEAPSVKALYVAVFNAGDILTELVKANPGTQSHPTTSFVAGEESENYLTYFNVTLQAVPSGVRYVQFIAVSDTLDRFEGSNVDQISEATFVQDLVTKYDPATDDHVVAFWARTNYNSILPNTDMKNIPMTRNFAKAQIDADASLSEHFKIYGFKIFDTPKSGTIAPFNINSDDYVPDGTGHNVVNFDRFVSFNSALGNSFPYSFITGTERGQLNYQGFTLSGVEYDDLSRYYDAGGTDNVPWKDPSASDYLYECSYRSNRNPFIIIKAKYSDAAISTESGWNSVDYSYYKADFVYNTPNGNKYYHILRNFLYTLHITGVNGKGSNTVYEAYNSIALNNFDGSTMSSLLNNIANEDSYIAVSYTDVLHTSGTSFTFYIKSRTGDNLATNDNANIVPSVRDSTSGGMIVKQASDIVISGADEGSGIYAGWRKVTVKVSKDPWDLNPGEVWKQPIVFTNSKGLTRTVNITMRKPFSLAVDVQDYVPKVKGEEVWVDFDVPAGLTQPRFPIYFYLEQEDNTLYPKPLAAGADATLSVESGPSLIPGRTNNNYYYRRTITWDEYSKMDSDINGIKTFRSYFLTLVPQSSTTVWVVASPDNDYYYPVDATNNSTNRDTFANNMEDGELSFERLGMQLNVGGTAYNLATANSGATVSYSSSDVNVAKVDPDGKVTGVGVGTATITATAPEYKNFEAPDPISYEVEVTELKISGLAVEWAREPAYVVKVNSTVTTEGTYATDTSYHAAVTYEYTSSAPGVATVSSNGTVTGVSAGTAVITYRADAAADAEHGFKGTSQSVSYTINVVAAHPASGTIYHNETFLTPSMGDYTVVQEIVTDGATYLTGNDRLADFKQYTYFSGTSTYRGLWYPYYTMKSHVSYGVAHSAWGAIEPPTYRYDPVQLDTVIDYHNARYSAYSQLASPEIDLSCSAGATLTFYHAGHYFYNRQNMKNDAHLRFSNDGGSTWSAPVDINYPPGTNWIYIKASVNIPSEYLVSNFRIAFDCSSIRDTFSRLYFEDNTYDPKKTTTTETDYPVFYATGEYDKTDSQGQPVLDENDNPVKETRILTTYTNVNTGYEVWVTNDDGRAGTWEIKNVLITEN